MAGSASAFRNSGNCIGSTFASILLLAEFVHGGFFSPMLNAAEGQGNLLSHVFTRTELAELSGDIASQHYRSQFILAKRGGGHILTMGTDAARNINEANFEWELIKAVRSEMVKDAGAWLEVRLAELEILDNLPADDERARMEMALEYLLETEQHALVNRLMRMVEVVRELHPEQNWGFSLPGTLDGLLRLLLVDFDQLEAQVPASAKVSTTEPRPGVEWSYDDNDESGPSNWAKFYPSCGGRRQSPIDVDVELTIPFRFPNLNFANLDVFDQNVTVQHDGHTAKVVLHDGDQNVVVTGGGLAGSFVLEQFHFHWGDPDTPGSEHELNHERMPAEMHMVFVNQKYGSDEEAVKHPDGIAVMGFFLDLQQEDNFALEKMFQALRLIERPKSLTTITGPIDIRSLIAPSLAGTFYRYNGSLTTPGCFEGVTWTLFHIPIGISWRQFNAFGYLRDERRPRQALRDNFRPLQALHGRRVYRKLIVV